ncbi:MAG: hypothetical protein J2O39_01895 [Acidimicrobiales bacterium]|nr:hypothetical protein [Acidimicrobiales bacterium]MBO0893102.1 hypothetical protein [Acidimicrobiales bacterium]
MLPGWQPFLTSRPLGPGAFSLEEAARRMGHYRWVELALFEALGGWVATVPEEEVRAWLSVRSHRHAWHAELWEQRLPELRGYDLDALTAPANREMERFVGSLTEPKGDDQTIEKLVGAYRVLLPYLVGAYLYHLERCSPVADGPTMRALELVLRDELEDWRDGELLVQWLLGTEEELQRASARQARLEAAIRLAGGVVGSGSSWARPPRPDGR